MTMTDQDRAIWLEARKKGLGASDAAAVLGMDPYRSPFAVWCEKTGQVEDDEQSDAMEWGLRLEDAVAEAFAEKSGLRLVRPEPQPLVHPAHQWMLASPDRWIVDRNGEPVGLYEGKTASAWADSWDGIEDGRVPDHVALQQQHQMAVAGLAVCHGAVLIGGQRFHTWTTVRDDRLIGDLIKAEGTWWQRYVMGRTPPPLDGHDATTAAISAMFPTSEPSELELPPEAVGIIARWIAAKDRVKEAEADEDTEANMIRLLLGPHEAGLIDGRKAVTWKANVTHRIDSKALRAAHPDIAAEFETESTVRPLKLARGYQP